MPLIRESMAEDAEAFARIYNHYILHTAVTFEEIPVDGEIMRERMAVVTGYGLPWTTLEVDGQVLGYAYASKWKDRAAYRHTVESSVYLAAEAVGRGLGRRLYIDLLQRLKAMKVHAVMGSISLPNEASVALHESLGFSRAGHFSEIGRKFDRWIDVGVWMLKHAS